MRFTRIPLIATLLAGALSLLVVLPAIAQSTQGVETDGRQSVGGVLEVQVYENIEDIRTRGAAAGAAAAAASATDAIVSFAAGTPETATTVSRGNHPLGLTDLADDAANDYIRVPNPRNTYFNGNLYVSNDDDAYNTILITAQVPNGASSLMTRDNAASDDPVTVGVDESTIGWSARLSGVSADCAIADVKNTRSGKKAKAVLFAVANPGGWNVDPSETYVYQGILTVWDRAVDRVEERNSECASMPLADPIVVTDPTMNPWSVETTGNQPAAVISARDGDTLEVTVAGVRGRLLLTVDGDKPTIANLSPEHNGTTNKSRVTLGFTVNDDGAGLRFDAEDGLSGDGDSSPANGDNDQRYNEPLTAGTQGSPGNGRTEDIQVYYADSITDVTADDPLYNDDDPDTECNAACEASIGTNPPPVGHAEFNNQEFSRYGSNGWTEVTLGRSYRLSMVLNSQAFAGHEWMIVAKDRVGNTFTTDADDDKDGPQPFKFTLDDQDPMIGEVRTGVKFDTGSSPAKEKADRSWIALSIVNEDAGGEDRVDRSSVQASDFTVSGATVVDAVVPTTKKECDAADDPDTTVDETANDVEDIDGNCGFDPRARIYLQLSSPLESDQTPTIQVLGGVFMDVAGNTNVVQSKSGSSNITDKIAPGVSITVTATGDATNRPATNDDGSFTIRVTSDEDLRRFPTVWFATIDGSKTPAGDVEAGDVGSSLQASAVNSVTPRELERNVWETKIDADSSNLPGSGSRLIAVLVTAEDEDRNKGNSVGWKPDSGATDPSAGATLDFKKLDDGGYLIEIDRSLPSPSGTDVQVQPAVQGETKITESLTPYVEIAFTGEKNEYGIDNRGGEGVFYKGYAGEDEDAIKTDSHEGVTLTKLEVDGVDRLADARRVGSDKGRFILAFVEGLSLGKHEVVYAATDDVGNELAANSAGAKEGKFTFTVRSRAGYKVSLRPGWNLISLPGTPTNPAVSAVLDGLQANTVLSYQEGEWLSAIRPADGEWQGTLEQIGGGYGYWVQTTAAETITAVIPPTLPNQVLPTVPITSGWNLVGVIDAAQRKVGSTAVQDPDKYFVNVSWRVAYGFDTQGSRWTKILPKPSGTDDGLNDSAVKNGSGYWLWSTEPGVLVP